MNFRMNKFLGGMAAGAAVLALSACLLPTGDGEGLDSIGNPVANVESLESIVPLFAIPATNCTGCHGTSAGLNLNGFENAFNSFFEIVDGDTIPRDASTTLGAGKKRINPGDASTSHLFERITMTGSGKMPLGPGRLSNADIERIRKWIDGGALIRDTTTKAP
jgi:mono/diheme cytochrome c family protein